MSTDTPESLQFSPEMTVAINAAYQEAAGLLNLRHTHSDRRAQLAKAIVELARAGVSERSILRDKAVDIVRRLDWIRHQAHEIWEAQGRPAGQHDQHWAQAEREWSTHGQNSL